MRFSKLQILIKLGREFGHEQIRGAGFTDTEHAICTFLCFHDHISQDTISAALLLDKTTVAKALRAMELKGLVERRQNVRNRRENLIRITEAGKVGVSSYMDIYDDWFAKVCSCLNEDESNQFDNYLDRIAAQALQMRQEANGKIHMEVQNELV